MSYLDTLQQITEVDKKAMKMAQKKLDMLTKPKGSLGRLEEIAKQVVGVTRKIDIAIKNKAIITVAGDHGVTTEKVSAFPSEVTPQMVYNFLNGGAAINVLARHINAKVVIVDAGVATDLNHHPELIVKKVGYGTKNMVIGPAMTREQAIKAIETGIEVAEAEINKGVDIIGTGDMGIGNTTPSSAITAVITQSEVEDITGRGTGIDDELLLNKINVIKKAIERNKPDKTDAIDVLGKIGGFEIGAIAGIIIACASRKVPVVVDGFISGAAALIAYTLEPKIKDYIIASHKSKEPGHKAILKHLKVKPILDLDMRLGEGTGAALAITIVESSLKIMNEMATFEQAGVSEKNG